MANINRLGAHVQEGSLVESAQRAQVLGLGAIQTFLGNEERLWPHNYSDDDIQAWLREQDRTGMVAVAHASLVVNLCYQQSPRYMQSVNAIIKLMLLADKLNFKYVVAHVGSCKEAGSAAGYNALVEATKVIMEMTAGCHVVLLYENAPCGGTQMGNIEVLSKVTAPYYGRMGICLDTAHAFAAGLDISDSQVREALWKQYGWQIKLVHFNNPEQKVKLGSHLDRHSSPWHRALWSEQTMVDIGSEWGLRCPLIMEVGDMEAVAMNVNTLEEAGLL